MGRISVRRGMFEVALPKSVLLSSIAPQAVFLSTAQFDALMYYVIRLFLMLQVYKTRSHASAINVYSCFLCIGRD